MLEEVFDGDAEWSVSQGCCIVGLRGMLDAVKDRDVGLSVGHAG